MNDFKKVEIEVRKALWNAKNNHELIHEEKHIAHFLIGWLESHYKRGGK